MVVVLVGAKSASDDPQVWLRGLNRRWGTQFKIVDSSAADSAEVAELLRKPDDEPSPDDDASDSFDLDADISMSRFTVKFFLRERF